MKWLRHFDIFKESKANTYYKEQNFVFEICVSMCLLNNEFLDNILDRGLKARYENSSVFITDLKNLLMAKNRLKIGKFDKESNKFIEDDDVAKINTLFNSISFDIEKDYNKLVNSRITARSIIDKLLPDEKLENNKISSIYWVGINKDKEYNEDIVIETFDGVQYSLFLNKSLSLQKTSSFNKFADDIIPNGIDNLFSEENIRKWNKLTQEWVRIIYEGSNKNIQQYIERFIDIKRISSIGYFEYFDIRHRDNRYKHLGEFIKEFDKNILKFSELMNEIWKNKETCILDLERVSKEWYEVKTVVLNSRILEHLFTNSLKTNNIDDIKKIDDEYKIASGVVKMKLMKSIVDKIGCLERDVYYLSNNGSNFYQIPSRDFFRKIYDDIDIHFDYHVKFDGKDYDDEDLNNFNIKVKLFINKEEFIFLNIIILFSGGEFTGNLSTKYKFTIPDNFNYQISKIKNKLES